LKLLSPDEEKTVESGESGWYLNVKTGWSIESPLLEDNDKKPSSLYSLQAAPAVAIDTSM